VIYLDKILEDIRVVDLTHVWFGPWCTRILAMLGADVIKIEPPWGGFIRYRPPLYGDAGSWFMCLNTEKRGMSLNLKHEKAKKIYFELVEKSDVIVNNFMPGTMERLGIAYNDVNKINPGIVYANLSGFGLTGPYSRRPSFAPIGEAYSSFTRLNGDLVDPEGPPLPTTDAFGDLVPGTWAALCIIAALRYRDKTGIGQEIDVTQIEVCTHMISVSMNNYVLTGELPWMLQDKFPAAQGLGGIMKTSDGYVRIAAPAGAHTDRLAKLIGVEELDREKFSEWVSAQKRDELVELLSKNDIPVGPVNHIPDVLRDPHMKARNAFTEIEDPRSPSGKLILPDFPVKLSKTPGKLTKRAPMLGEHNDEILTTLLGYSKEEIEQLRKEKAIR